MLETYITEVYDVLKELENLSIFTRRCFRKSLSQAILSFGYETVGKRIYNHTNEVWDALMTVRYFSLTKNEIMNLVKCFDCIVMGKEH